jgi:hypothetical protein
MKPILIVFLASLILISGACNRVGNAVDIQGTWKVTTFTINHLANNDSSFVWDDDDPFLSSLFWVGSFTNCRVQFNPDGSGILRQQDTTHVYHFNYKFDNLRLFIQRINSSSTGELTPGDSGTLVVQKLNATELTVQNSTGFFQFELLRSQ